MHCKDAILDGLAWSFIRPLQICLPSSSSRYRSQTARVPMRRSRRPQSCRRVPSCCRRVYSQPHTECNSTLKVTSPPGADTAQNTSSIDKNACLGVCIEPQTPDTLFPGTETRARCPSGTRRSAPLRKCRDKTANETRSPLAASASGPMKSSSSISSWVMRRLVPSRGCHCITRPSPAMPPFNWPSEPLLSQACPKSHTSRSHCSRAPARATPKPSRASTPP